MDWVVKQSEPIGEPVRTEEKLEDLPF